MGIHQVSLVFRLERAQGIARKNLKTERPFLYSLVLILALIALGVVLLSVIESAGAQGHPIVTILRTEPRDPGAKVFFTVQNMPIGWRVIFGDGRVAYPSNVETSSEVWSWWFYPGQYQLSFGLPGNNGTMCLVVGADHQVNPCLVAATATPVPAQAPATGLVGFNAPPVDQNWVQILAPSLRIRECADLSCAIVARARQGSYLIVLTIEPVESDGFLWIPVYWGPSTYGWVASEHTTYASG